MRLLRLTKDSQCHLNCGRMNKCPSLPTMGVMLKDQIGGDIPAEIHAQMLARYAVDL